MEQSLLNSLKRFSEGDELRAYHYMGCHKGEQDGREGFFFRVWAPKAHGVSLAGDWNGWDIDAEPFQWVKNGIWEAFTPHAKEGDAYKFCIRSADGSHRYKSDPYAFRNRLPSGDSIICDLTGFQWCDAPYRRLQGKKKILDCPVNIYELHLGSWKRKPDGGYLNYDELAEELIPYVKEMGYTHIELLPLIEDPSRDHQISGYYAPAECYGTPKQLMGFVDKCHEAGIGVFLDWVSTYFSKDENGLIEFDGSCCYELADSAMDERSRRSARIFDYGKGEVQSFLISNAVYWMEMYHFDGIRMDGVASILYLDHGRKEFRPNKYGGRENLEAIAFLRKLNRAIFSVRRSAVTIAEESTAFPLVTKPDYDGGLGFLFKWNSSWTGDMLHYLSLDPLFRKNSHNNLTFPMTYAYSENFILPLSHDEVACGKMSLIEKMPGDYDSKFSNLRTLYGFMMGHPGKKLSFMGNEFAQFKEWSREQGLDWLLLGYERHRQMQSYVRDLNRFYLENSSLWNNDVDWTGFQWIIVDDCDNSVISFRRIDHRGREVLCVCNFCPVTRENYLMGLPRAGHYEPVFNSDDVKYGGTGTKLPVVVAHKNPKHGQEYSGEFTLAPLSVTFYKRILPQRNMKNDKEK